MATTAPAKPLGPSGPMGPYRGGPGHGPRLPASRYTTGMYLGLAAVTMLFAAFTSAYIVRKGLSNDWRPVALPSIVWGSTLLLLLSSGTIEKARRRLIEPAIFRRWWLITSLLGLGFLAGQATALRELVHRGVFLATNPSSSFLYVLTTSHGVHLFGGIVAVLWILWRNRRKPSPQLSTAVGVTSLYWHFMDGLWMYILLLLTIWR